MRQKKKNSFIKRKAVETTREIFNLQLNNLSSAVSLLFPHSLLNYNGNKKICSWLKTAFQTWNAHTSATTVERRDTDGPVEWLSTIKSNSFVHDRCVVVVGCIIIAFTLNYVHIYLIFNAYIHISLYIHWLPQSNWSIVRT